MPETAYSFVLYKACFLCFLLTFGGNAKKKNFSGYGLKIQGSETNISMYVKSSVMSEKDGYVVVFGCKRCGKCRDICPVGAIYEENELAKIDPNKCNLCMKCIDVCTNKSIIYME